MKQAIWGICLLTLVLGLALAGPARSSAATLHDEQAQVSCTARDESVKPPDFAPVPASPEGRGEPVIAKDLSPICPDGQVPLVVPMKPDVPKGNPLLGVRPLQRLRGARPHAPDDAEKCEGVINAGTCYYYANASYSRAADGGGMTMSIEQPTYIGGTGHTLAEIAVQGGAGNGNIIELGWNVSTSQYGDAEPHLFVFHWIDWVPTCYDGCNWQQWSGTYYPGMSLRALVGQPSYVGYVYYNGNWWAWFNNQWLGYFPGSEWPKGYTSNGLIQWFGEVATNNGVPPRTDMGNGLAPSNPSAAVMSTLCDVDARAWVCWYRDQQVLSATVPAYYDIARTDFGQVRYGGPGE